MADAGKHGHVRDEKREAQERGRQDQRRPGVTAGSGEEES